ncbi:hypothetical protein C9975_07805 [Thalassospira xiamenensis]|nr:hypothetical protein C9975_07805 [Thalassospira xiamenensis]
MQNIAAISNASKGKTLFEQNELVFWQDPFASKDNDNSGLRVIIYSPLGDTPDEAIYRVSDLQNELSEVHHHELSLADKSQTEAWYIEAEQQIKSPFNKGDVVLWDEPAGNFKGVLFRVAVVPDVRNFAPYELLNWPELFAEAALLINTPEGSEAGVYPHEIRKPTEEELSSFYVACGGSRCPYCLGDMIDGDSITVDGGQAFQPVSCTDCLAEWTDVYSLSKFEA